MDLIETFEELEPQLDEYQRKQLSEHLERATEAFQQIKSRRATSPGVDGGSAFSGASTGACLL
jgi:hypothetical protein